MSTQPAADPQNFGNQISDKEFQYFKNFIYEKAGIAMSDAKKSLVTGRLAKRVRFYNLRNYTEYLRLLEDPAYKGEKQIVVDLLTTNETYFFRETKHFDFLQNQILPPLSGTSKVRVWCAASSSGEEAYSLGMVLNEVLGNHRWEMLASDISSRVLETARRGLYPEAAIEKIPKHYLPRYCLKGVRSQSGNILMDKSLRDNIEFRSINLIEPLPGVGQFDVIFLRNVMIYFDQETKRQVVNKLLAHVKFGGYFIVSHAETLHNTCKGLKAVSPSIYRKMS